jgi:hypothetical protein
MRKGSINIIEMHVEKAVLGLAVLFAIAMAVLYLPSSPNKIEYRNEPRTPDQLDEAILQSARTLQSRQANATAERKEVPNYSADVVAVFKGGILGEQPGAQPLSATLRPAAPWGEPIPQLQERGTAGREPVALVMPVAPEAPAARAGRSRVVAAPVVLTAEGATANPMGDGSGGNLKELGWVSVAAYWDWGAQQTQHTSAKYATARARPYIARIAAQRQELLPSGEWSDWQDVSPRESMPKLDIPTPQFDELTGRLTNRADIEAAFTAIKNNQLVVAQPPFFEVHSGDRWYIPPIAGYSEADWRRYARAEEQARPTEPVVAAGGPPPNMYGGGPGGRPGGMGGRAGMGRPGGAGFNPYAQQPGQTPGGQPPAVSARDARRQVQLDFAAARRAYLARDYISAKSLAEQVSKNDQARGRLKKAVDLLLERIELEEKLTRYNAPRWDPLAQMTADRGPGVTKTDSKQVVAVWFHDDTAVPGRTYRYRLRVDLWNRYVNRPSDLANPDDAKRVVLTGEWSAPSEPIAAPPGIEFFVQPRPAPGGEAVQVEVWKWHDGWWYAQTFDVKPGDSIGGKAMVTIDELSETDAVRQEIDFSTGAVVESIALEEALSAELAGERNARLVGRPTIVLTYKDADGTVHRKAAIVDAGDPLYATLRDQYQ